MTLRIFVNDTVSVGGLMTGREFVETARRGIGGFFFLSYLGMSSTQSESGLYI